MSKRVDYSALLKKKKIFSVFHGIFVIMKTYVNQFCFKSHMRVEGNISHGLPTSSFNFDVENFFEIPNYFQWKGD